MKVTSMAAILLLSLTIFSSCRKSSDFRLLKIRTQGGMSAFFPTKVSLYDNLTDCLAETNPVFTSRTKEGTAAFTKTASQMYYVRVKVSGRDCIISEQDYYEADMSTIEEGQARYLIIKMNADNCN